MNNNIYIFQDNTVLSKFDGEMNLKKSIPCFVLFFVKSYHIGAEAQVVCSEIGSDHDVTTCVLHHEEALSRVVTNGVIVNTSLK